MSELSGPDLELMEEFQGYLRLHTREGDCHCERHQKQVFEMAGELAGMAKKYYKETWCSPSLHRSPWTGRA